jgi:hypothetical protein
MSSQTFYAFILKIKCCFIETTKKQKVSLQRQIIFHNQNSLKNALFETNIYIYMKKPIISMLVLFSIFILIGCLDLTSDTSKEISIGNTLASPKNAYLATSYTAMGGGAAGWCYQHVSIRKVDEPFDAEKDVFTTRCSSKLEFYWSDESNVNIGFSDESLFEPETQWEKVKISYYLIHNNK